MSRLVALALAAASTSCFLENGFPGGVCTAIGCYSGAQLPVFETPDGTVLMGATVHVCRNSACSEATITQLPPLEQGTGSMLTGDLRADLTVWRRAAGYEITVEVIADGPYPYGLANGDVYTAELRDGAAVLSTRAWTATYAESQPNGPDCEPRCLQASLAPR